jgi:hypothetical protein
MTARLLEIPDFARRWGNRSPRTVRKYIKLGWISYVRIGRRGIRIPESELSRLMVFVPAAVDFKALASGEREDS